MPGSARSRPTVTGLAWASSRSNSPSGSVRPPLRRTCAAVADRYADALFAFLTTDRSAVSVGLEHYVSESTLYRLRKAFYEQYACGAAEQQERKEG